MKFYHSTTEASANSIENQQNIRMSKFNVWEFLDWWMDSLKYAAEQEDLPPIPERYPIGRRDRQYIFTLGQGIYCFREEHLKEAEDYSPSHNAIVEINTQDVPIFSMYSLESEHEILRFLDAEFNQFLNTGNFTDEQRETYQVVKLLLQDSIHDKFETYPQAAGILLEIYNYLCNNKIKIASNKIYKVDESTHQKKISEYVVIKDTKVVENYKKIQ